jgi:hypothetical protein
MGLGNSRTTRNLLAALCIVLPVLFYFGIFYFSINQIVWDGQSVARFAFSEDGYCITGAASPVILLDVLSAMHRIMRLIELHPVAAEAVFKFRVAELAGRLDFVLPSILLRSVALISFAMACYIIWRSMRLDSFRLIVAMAAIVVAGCFFGSRMDAARGTRVLLMDPILSAEPAPLISYPSSFDLLSFELNHHAPVDLAVSVNLYLGAIAILAILAGLAAVTAGQNPGGGGAVSSTAREPSELRERMGFLKTLIGFEVAIFILLILITMTATDWVTGLVCYPERDALIPISTALKYYWGVSASGVIISSLLPAYYSWRSDVSSYAESLASSKSFKEAQSALDDEGLTFTPTQTILSLLTVALPALTTPLVDIAQRMAGLGS